MDTDPISAGLSANATSARTIGLKSDHAAKVEIVTCAEPRRRWTIEQKQAIAAESLTPGASPTAVARRHAISTGLLYTWRKALLAAQPMSSRFARVELAAETRPLHRTPTALPPPSTPPSNLIEIVLPNNTSVRLDARIDPRALRRIVSVLSRP